MSEEVTITGEDSEQMADWSDMPGEMLDPMLAKKGKEELGNMGNFE